MARVLRDVVLFNIFQELSDASCPMLEQLDASTRGCTQVRRVASWRVTVSQSSISVIVTSSGVLFDMEMESATKTWRLVGAAQVG
jgi:hypothetical protein